MFKYFQPNKIFSITSRAPKYVFILFIIVLSIGLVESLILSPEDYKQSHSVRIMYVHVPAAWITLGIFSSMTFLSIIGYIFKIRNFFLISKSLAPSGLVFNIIALVTGSIWGKPTWGTWWVWDARLTSTLVLLLLFLGIIALRNALEEKGNDGRPCAVLALVGLVNLPIIKYSVDWWFTLHQPASFALTEKPKMPPEMWIPLLLMAAGYYLFVFSVWSSRIRNEIISRERKTAWAKAWAGSQ